MKRISWKKRSHRGGILVIVLVYIVITAFIIAGILSLGMSHYARVHTEADYAAALNAAEAGVNFELRKISQNPATADQAGASSPPGVTYAFANNAYRVYCTNRDGTTPWASGNPLYIYSVGSVHGTSRTVRVATKYVNNTVTWNLASYSGSLSGPQTYTGSGFVPATITARGYQATNAPGASTWNTGSVSSVNLYGKVTPGDPTETGLGLANDSQFEIAGNNFIQLDLTNAKANNLVNVSMTIGSIQQGEGYIVWGSNTLGSPGTKLATYTNSTGATGADVSTFLLPSLATYKYFSISAIGDNILIDSTVTALSASGAFYSYDNEWTELYGM